MRPDLIARYYVLHNTFLTDFFSSMAIIAEVRPWVSSCQAWLGGLPQYPVWQTKVADCLLWAVLPCGPRLHALGWLSSRPSLRR